MHALVENMYVCNCTDPYARRKVCNLGTPILAVGDLGQLMYAVGRFIQSIHNNGLSQYHSPSLSLWTIKQNGQVMLGVMLGEVCNQDCPHCRRLTEHAFTKN